MGSSAARYSAVASIYRFQQNSGDSGAAQRATRKKPAINNADVRHRGGSWHITSWRLASDCLHVVAIKMTAWRAEKAKTGVSVTAVGSTI